MGLLGEVFDPVTSYVRLDISLKFQHTNSHRYILNRPYCIDYKRAIEQNQERQLRKYQLFPKGLVGII